MSGHAMLRGGPHGKDLVLIAPREELAQPSRVSLPEPEPAPGLILPDGAINWGCPCLGGMATGPCGAPFREAFSCFHYSAAEPKGSDCYDKFSTMQECMARYPQLYNREDEDELGAALAEADAGSGGDKATNAASDNPPDEPVKQHAHSAH